MTTLRDSLTEYLDLYRPIKFSFMGWQSQFLRALTTIIAVPVVIVCSLLLSCLSGKNGLFLYHAAWYGCGLLPYLLLIISITSWMAIAFANLRTADALLDQALLGRRGSTAVFRLILAVYSGVWPAALFLLGITAFSIAGLISFLLAEPQVRSIMLMADSAFGFTLDSASGIFVFHIWGWINLYLFYGVGVIASLAIACMTCRQQFAWMILLLLDLQLLLDTFRSFHPFNNYWAVLYRDSHDPGIIGLLITTVSLLMLPGIVYAHLLRSDRLLMGMLSLLAIFRFAHLYIYFSGMGNIRYYGDNPFVADPVMSDVVSTIWQFNSVLAGPLFFFPFEYYDMFNRVRFPASSVTEVSIAMQGPLTFQTGAIGYILILLGNLLWLALILYVCLVSVRSHDRELIT